MLLLHFPIDRAAVFRPELFTYVLITLPPTNSASANVNKGVARVAQPVKSAFYETRLQGFLCSIAILSILIAGTFVVAQPQKSPHKENKPMESGKRENEATGANDFDFQLEAGVFITVV